MLHKIYKKIFSFSAKDLLTTLFILLAITAACLFINRFNDGDIYVPMMYSLAVLLVSRYTNGYFWGVFSSILSVVIINYFFTEPHFAFDLLQPGYPIAFAVMLTGCIITGASTTQLVEKEKIRTMAEKERMRANLLRAVSHDLRTPLTSISGSASVLIDNDGKIDKAERRSLLIEIQEEAQWLIRMVENLLAVTRISNENGELHKTVEVVEEIAAEAVQKLKKRYPDAPIRVYVPDDILFVPMDAILIEQVLINLMENSIRHGEHVTKIKLEILQKGEFAVFKLTDNGCGFDRKKLDNLFDGNVSSNNPNSDITKDMGIGLSVCKSIINAHGGSVEAENIIGGGACVKFSLPLEAENV